MALNLSKNDGSAPQDGGSSKKLNLNLEKKESHDPAIPQIKTEVKQKEKSSSKKWLLFILGGLLLVALIFILMKPASKDDNQIASESTFSDSLVQNDKTVDDTLAILNRANPSISDSSIASNSNSDTYQVNQNQAGQSTSSVKEQALAKENKSSTPPASQSKTKSEASVQSPIKNSTEQSTSVDKVNKSVTNVNASTKSPGAKTAAPQSSTKSEASTQTPNIKSTNASTSVSKVNNPVAGNVTSEVNESKASSRQSSGQKLSKNKTTLKKTENTNDKTTNKVDVTSSSNKSENKAIGNFPAGSTELNFVNNALVNEIISYLNEDPLNRGTILGFASSDGEINKNQLLSVQRAIKFKNYLIQKGVDQNKITTKGMGVLNPIADNSTAEGRQKNRRVEFVKE